MARTVCLREWLKWVEREQMRVINLEPAAAPAAEVPEFQEVLKPPKSARPCMPRWSASITFPMRRGCRGAACEPETNQPLPSWGKTILFNGKTGESFDQAVTVASFT